MSRSLGAAITGVGIYTQRFPTARAWMDAAPCVVPAELRPRILDRQCIRRASAFSKAMAIAFEQAALQARAELAEVATVFGSALGEASVMLKLLDQVPLGIEEVSPMHFAVSVHNAASGFVSISSKNRGFTTSIAADYDTPAMGLFEACAVSRDLRVPVVLVCGEEEPPPAVAGATDAYETLAVAIVVDAASEGPAGLARIGRIDRSPADLDFPDVAPELARNPQVGLLDLADAVLRGRRGRLRLDRKRGAGWSVQIDRGS